MTMRPAMKKQLDVLARGDAVTWERREAYKPHYFMARSQASLRAAAANGETDRNIPGEPLPTPTWSKIVHAGYAKVTARDGLWDVADVTLTPAGWAAWQEAESASLAATPGRE